MVKAEQLLEYLRLPPDSKEDAERYLSAAKSKARAAGIKDFKNNAQYDLFILSLAAMYYDNRGMTFGGSYQATAEANARQLINSFVLELRHAEEDPEPEEAEENREPEEAEEGEDPAEGAAENE